ncbi:hypothetical protein ACIQF6_09495 [Kitasatospora sp. NPDC092948]|uniref:hypothetical protein n=1 Tax=Kitasatospora sp. NPDC092948 TaxID=3364088 RepID=UPI00382AEF4F
MRTLIGSALRRALGAGLAVAAVGAATIGLTGAAHADSEPVLFQLKDAVIQPGESDRPLGPTGIYGRGDGTWVYAVSSKPLTDAGASLHLPDGMTVAAGTTGSNSPNGQNSTCTAVVGTTGVYTCAYPLNASLSSPLISASAAVPDGTAVYYGTIFVPGGQSVDDAVARVKTVGSSPADGLGSEGAAKVTVLTRDHVAGNTLRPTAPDLPAGQSVTQQVKVHAVDAGTLRLFFNSADGQPSWPFFPTPIGVRVTGTTATPAGSCGNVSSDLNSPTVIAWCDLPAGDSTVSYTLAAQPDLVSWKVDVRAEYHVYTWANGNPTAHATFAFLGTTPAPSASPTASPTGSPTPTPTGSTTTPAPTTSDSPTPTATETPTDSPTATTTTAAVGSPSVPTGGALASTGADALVPTLAGGLSLLAGGGATLLALHRRRRGSHS